MTHQHASAAADGLRASADIHAPPFPEDEDGEILPSGRLAPLAKKSVCAGHVVYDVGRAPHLLYRMSCGYVIVSQPLRDGRRSIVDLIEPGRLFGFCSSGQHDCTATTTEPGTLCIYSATQALAHPREAVAAMASAVAQLDRVRNLATLRSRRAVERLATFLVHLLPSSAVEAHSLELPLSRSELSDFLQLTNETVSRGFAELRAAGAVVAEGRRRVHVLDRSRLAAIAHGEPIAVAPLWDPAAIAVA